MQDKIVVGLDIGTTKICAMVGRMNKHGKLEIIGMGKAVSEGVIRGKVINIEKTMNAIMIAIEEAGEQSDIIIRSVNAGIAGMHIKSMKQHGSIVRTSEDSEISHDDVERLTNDMYKLVVPPGNKIIHVMPQSYVVDHEPGIKDPVGMSGIRLEADFHVITADTEAIKNINKCIERADLETDQLILEPLASSLSVLSNEEKEAGVVLVDIGGGTTDVAIFYDGIIRHTAVIPFGGNIITEDIKKGLGVMQNQAEKLKTVFGGAMEEFAEKNKVVTIPGFHNRNPKEISITNLAAIIEARMQDIIEYVMAEIDNSGFKQSLSAGLVLTGGGSQLKHVQQLFEYMTGLDTRIGHPNEHLGKAINDDIKSPMYATTVGLVLAGFVGLDERQDPLQMHEGLANSVGTGKKKKVWSAIQEKVYGLLMNDVDEKDAFKE